MVRYFIHTTTILTCHYLLSAPENKFENFDTVVRFRSNGDPEVTITIKVMISFIVVLENGFQKNKEKITCMGKPKQGRTYKLC